MAAVASETLFPLKDLVSADDFPLAQLVPEDALEEVLDGLYYTEAEAFTAGDNLTLRARMTFESEIALKAPGVEDLAIVLGSSGPGWTSLDVELVIGPEASASLRDVPVALRIPPAVLKDVATGGPAEIEFKATLSVDSDWNLTLETDASLSLDEAEIAGSGVTVSATRVSWNFERGRTLPEAVTAGISGEFVGVAFQQAKVKLPKEIANAPELTFDYCCIGTGGFSGGVSLSFQTPPECDLGGFQVALQRVGIRFQESQLVNGEIAALLKDLDFFDTDVALDIQLQAGGLRVAIAAAPDRQTGNAEVKDGLVTLRKPDIVSMTLKSAELAVGAGKGALRLAGTITPEVSLPGGDPLPAFGVKALTITSTGEVSVEGGWIDMPRATRLRLGPFGLQITRAALGSEPNGERWVGFSGAVSLAAGVPVTAAADGLKIRWDQTGFKGVDLAGIGLKFEVPGVLKFAGEVRFMRTEERFEGGGSLELTSLGLNVTARVIIGKRADYTYMRFYLLVAPPVGVPIFSTGLAFYSLEALYARHMEPDKKPAERWFHDWYRRPELGVVDVKKWGDRRDSQAFGAGVTVGTLPDKGYSVALKGLLIVVVPGPVILLDARANILKDPAALARPDAQALFNSLIVYDGRQGTLELAIEPHYVFPDAGELVDVGGIAEAFYSFNDPRAWHLYLGKREREQRIRARLLSLFEANAYLMLDPDSLELGGFIGYDATYTAGPAKLTLQAYIEGAAGVSFRPKQFMGYLHLQGAVAVSIFGIGLGISALARLEVQAPRPFDIYAQLQAKVDLPFPIPDLEVAVELHWEAPKPPELTVPLQAAGVEHSLTKASWPLGGAPPVVPLDGRLSLAFDRPLNDDVRIGANAQAAPDRTMGEYSIRAGLTKLELQALDESTEPPTPSPYATPTGGAAGGPRKLYGMWQTTPGDSGQGNRRLELWVRTPYEWTRALSEPAISQLEKAEDFSPCEPLVETQLIEFDDHPNQVLPPGTALSHAGVTWTAGSRGAAIVELDQARGRDSVEGALPKPYYRCLFLPDQLGVVVVTSSGLTPVSGPGAAPAPGPALRLDFPGDLKGLVVLALASGPWSMEGFDAAGSSLGNVQADIPAVVGRLRVSQLVLRKPKMRRVDIEGAGLRTAILAVAVQGAPSEPETTSKRTAIEQTLERFKGEEPILEPNRGYRLLVETELTESGGKSLDGAEIEAATLPGQISGTGSSRTIKQSFDFRTEGPPGATSVKVARLDTLEPYVREVMPPRGAPAVYRNYDLGAAFNADYVDQMYRSDGRSLVLQLRSDQGEKITVSNTMGRGNEVVLRREERAWLSTLSRSSCKLTVAESQIVRESAVKAQLPASALGARRRYDVSLVGEKSGGNPTPPLYSWSFVSSEFRNFADHFKLGGRVRRAKIRGLTWTQFRTSLKDALAAGDPWLAGGAERERRRAVETRAFEQLFASFDVGRSLPTVVELYALVAGAETWGVLISSPEPFDWERLRLALTVPPGTTLPGRPVRLRTVRDADGTRAIAVAMGIRGLTKFVAGTHTLAGTFKRAAVPGLPVLSERGSSADETATISWSIPVA